MGSGYVDGQGIPATILDYAVKVAKTGKGDKPVLVVIVSTEHGTLKHDAFVDEDAFGTSNSRAETMRRLSEIAGRDIAFTESELDSLKGLKCEAVPFFVSTKNGGFYNAKYLNPLVKGAMNRAQLDLLFGAPKSSERDHPTDHDNGNRPESNGKINPQADDGDDIPF